MWSTRSRHICHGFYWIPFSKSFLSSSSSIPSPDIAGTDRIGIFLALCWPKPLCLPVCPSFYPSVCSSAIINEQLCSCPPRFFFTFLLSCYLFVWFSRMHDPSVGQSAPLFFSISFRAVFTSQLLHKTPTAIAHPHKIWVTGYPALLFFFFLLCDKIVRCTVVVGILFRCVRQERISIRGSVRPSLGR